MTSNKVINLTLMFDTSSGCDPATIIQQLLNVRGVIRIFDDPKTLTTEDANRLMRAEKERALLSDELDIAMARS